MNCWIICILRIRNELERMWAAIDKTETNAAMSITCDALELCEFLEELNDRKRRLANMKVLFDAAARALSADELNMLSRYAANVSADTLAEELGVSRHTVLRRIKKALRTAGGAVTALGYDKEKLERDYFPFAVIKALYESVAKRQRASAAEKRDTRAA